MSQLGVWPGPSGRRCWIVGEKNVVPPNGRDASRWKERFGIRVSDGNREGSTFYLR